MSQTFKTQADVMVATAGKVDNTNDEVQGEPPACRESSTLCAEAG